MTCPTSRTSISRRPTLAKRSDHELLVVDGYNVIFGTPRYKALMDEPDARQLDHDPVRQGQGAARG